MNHFSLMDDAIGYAQSLYAARGYEHFAAIQIAEELVHKAFNEPGETVVIDDVTARYGTTTNIDTVSSSSGYAIGPAKTNVGDAHAEVREQAESRIAHIRMLNDLAAETADIDSYSNDDLLALGIGYAQPGALELQQIVDEARERLRELPLVVEQRTQFEVVLGTGGPDDRLIFECHHDGLGAHLSEGYEIERVLYRYSWTGTAEVELEGEDREIAEAFAREVVPELAE